MDRGAERGSRAGRGFRAAAYCDRRCEDGLLLAQSFVANLCQREFTPDMKRLFRKHAPKKIRKIEEKVPIPADDKP